MTEYDKQPPAVSTVSMNFEIFHSRTPRGDPRFLIVEVCNDGSVYAHWKDASTFGKPVEGCDGTFHSWELFKRKTQTLFFPDYADEAFRPAQMIEDWMKNNKISVPWTGG